MSKSRRVFSILAVTLLSSGIACTPTGNSSKKTGRSLPSFATSRHAEGEGDGGDEGGGGDIDPGDMFTSTVLSGKTYGFRLHGRTDQAYPSLQDPGVSSGQFAMNGTLEFGSFTPASPGPTYGIKLTFAYTRANFTTARDQWDSTYCNYTSELDLSGQKTGYLDLSCEIPTIAGGYDFVPSGITTDPSVPNAIQLPTKLLVRDVNVTMSPFSMVPHALEFYTTEASDLGALVYSVHSELVAGDGWLLNETFSNATLAGDYANPWNFRFAAFDGTYSAMAYMHADGASAAAPFDPTTQYGAVTDNNGSPDVSYYVIDASGRGFYYHGGGGSSNPADWKCFHLVMGPQGKYYTMLGTDKVVWINGITNSCSTYGTITFPTP